MERPDGIILTVSAGMIGKNGYRHWLSNFLSAMAESERTGDMFYWFRTSAQPKNDSDLRHVYLCIGGKIRFRVYYAGSQGEKTMKFENRDQPIHGRAWILAAGPVERPKTPIKRKGFQGFRYTSQLF